MTQKIIRLNSPELVEQYYIEEKFPLVKKAWSETLQREINVYNYDDKSVTQCIYEILHMPTANGNRMTHLLELIKMVREGKK